jgi:hypothetical protein
MCPNVPIVVSKSEIENPKSEITKMSINLQNLQIII